MTTRDDLRVVAMIVAMALNLLLVASAFSVITDRKTGEAN